jgi:hypothetical protein
MGGDEVVIGNLAEHKGQENTVVHTVVQGAGFGGKGRAADASESVALSCKDGSRGFAGKDRHRDGNDEHPSLASVSGSVSPGGVSEDNDAKVVKPHGVDSEAGGSGGT